MVNQKTGFPEMSIEERNAILSKALEPKKPQPGVTISQAQERGIDQRLGLLPTQSDSDLVHLIREGEHEYDHESSKVYSQWVIEDAAAACLVAKFRALERERNDADFKLYQDGGMWCCVRRGFLDLQLSPAYFGYTPQDALSKAMEAQDAAEAEIQDTAAGV